MTEVTLESDVTAWALLRPQVDGASLPRDARRLAEWHSEAGRFLPALESAGSGAAVARRLYRDGIRTVHAPFVRAYLDLLGEQIARTDATSPATIAAAIGDLAPALIPSRLELAADAQRGLELKLGYEYKLAVLYSELLASPHTGALMIERARRETRRARDEQPRFQSQDLLDLGSARMRRDGQLATIEIARPHRLNAEDEGLLDALEVCVDVALLDPRVEIVLLRGAHVASRKYAGQRIFCSGLDLTELYEGRLSYDYFLRRELGLVSKIFRGLSVTADRPEVEKPFVVVIDGHAIGGGLQLLLVADYVIADERASLRLPARREGIIPGVANLRLPRLLGERAARRAILLDAVIPVSSPEGRMLVDETHPAEMLDAAAATAVAELASSGVVSLAANRKAMRIGQEPADEFRAYMAHFALAQADCYFSPALAANLRRHWIARAGDARLG